MVASGSSTIRSILSGLIWLLRPTLGRFRWKGTVTSGYEKTPDYDGPPIRSRAPRAAVLWPTYVPSCYKGRGGRFRQCQTSRIVWRAPSGSFCR